MLWLVNKRSAYGARSGPLPLIKEIIIRFFIVREEISDINASCEFGNIDNGLSCYMLLDTL